MPQMPGATRVGPRDGDEGPLLSTIREGVPPGRAGLRTSYGEATRPTGAGSGPVRAFAAPRHRARGERHRGRLGTRAAAVSTRETELRSPQPEPTRLAPPDAGARSTRCGRGQRRGRRAARGWTRAAPASEVAAERRAWGFRHARSPWLAVPRTQRSARAKSPAQVADERARAHACRAEHD